MFCKECGTKLKYHDSICQKCGVPTPKDVFVLKKSNEGAKYLKNALNCIGVLIVALLGVALWGGIIDGALPDSDFIISGETESHATARSNRGHFMRVDLQELLNAYEDNEISADKKYKGNIIETNGVIIAFGQVFGIPYVLLQGGKFTFTAAHCSFYKGEAQSLSKLSKGDRITIRGRCDGWLGYVIIRDAQTIDSN